MNRLAGSTDIGIFQYLKENWQTKEWVASLLCLRRIWLFRSNLQRPEELIPASNPTGRFTCYFFSLYRLSVSLLYF